MNWEFVRDGRGSETGVMGRKAIAGRVIRRKLMVRMRGKVEGVSECALDGDEGKSTVLRHLKFEIKKLNLFRDAAARVALPSPSLAI